MTSLYVVAAVCGVVRLVQYDSTDGVLFRAPFNALAHATATERQVRGDVVMSRDGFKFGPLGKWISTLGGMHEFWTADKTLAQAVLDTFPIAQKHA